MSVYFEWSSCIYIYMYMCLCVSANLFRTTTVCILNDLSYWSGGRAFANNLREQRSIPRLIKPKTQKAVLDAALLNTAL